MTVRRNRSRTVSCASCPIDRRWRRWPTFYQAADLYLHAAKAENLPTTILEALASGLPVVATAVGGIPEEVRSLAGAPGAWSGEGHPRDEATGVLVAPGDACGHGRRGRGPPR